VTEAGAAGLSQAINSPRKWGGGPEGYARRFANDMAYNGVRCSLAYLSSNALHEDDRYFGSGKSGVWLRLRHGVVRVFTAHKDDGRTVFATSSLIGIMGASLTSRAWAPDNWQTGSSVGRRGFLPERRHK
jgi:hypothetical protein